MADIGSPGGRDAAILALAAGATVREAAREAGVGERTIHRWRSEDPSFLAAVERARDELFDANFAALVGAGRDAVQTLQDLLDTGPPPVRLGAARAILDQLCRYREVVELQRRVAELERQTMDPSGDPNGWDADSRAA